MPCITFSNKLVLYSKELLAPCSTPNLWDHLLSAVHDGLFSIFAATLHIWRLSLHLKTHHAVWQGPT
jgi:hypothetical protein